MLVHCFRRTLLVLVPTLDPGYIHYIDEFDLGLTTYTMLQGWESTVVDVANVAMC